jgi:membrane-associated phospholipid phosphatase
MEMSKRLAKLTSNIINPFLVSFTIILLLSFESTASAADALKWALLAVALSVLPVFIAIIYLVHKRKLDGIFINPRQQRYKTYLMSSAWAIVSCAVLYFLGAPALLMTTFIAGLAAMVTFMGINLIWKISLHTAFVAASVTILVITYGPVGLWSAVLLPPVAWARLNLKHHSPAQVAAGALLSAAIVLLVFHLCGQTGTSV